MIECVQVKRLVLIFFVGVLCLCSCSLRKHVAKVSAQIEKMYGETKSWNSLPERTITWNQALTMLRRDNLDLKDAEDSIEQAERDSLSIYTEMIPGMSYYGYMTRTLSRLADPIDAAELNSRVNVQFNIPMLTQIPYRVYSSKVRTFAAIKAKEGRERELVSKLYQQVRMREIESAKRALAAKNKDEDGESAVKRMQSQEQSDQKYWQEVARLLGNSSARWNILPESMPHVQWDDYSSRLDRLGELVVCQFAMRLEQARMAQYGIALRYLPTINTSIYSPSLFSSTGGTYEGTFLNGDDTNLNLSISYTLDTQLSSWNSYQQSKARYEREKSRVVSELMDHKNKVETLRNSVTQYMHWRSFMMKRMEYLRSQKLQSAEDFIERERTLYSMESELLTQESSVVESEAAMVLEYGMPDELEGSAKPRREP